MTPGAPGRTRAVLVYSVARVAVLVAVFGLLYLVGLRGPLLVLVALLGSGAVSYVLLAPQRVTMARALGGRPRRARRRFADRIAASAAAEDAYVDSLEAARPDRAATNRTDRDQGD